MNILFINGSPNKGGNTASLAGKLLAGKEYRSLHLVDYRLYSYGPVSQGALSGRKFVFLFQGAAPEKWMLEKAEYTMSRFARMYGMEYVGMATDSKEAEEIAKKL